MNRRLLLAAAAALLSVPCARVCAQAPTAPPPNPATETATRDALSRLPFNFQSPSFSFNDELVVFQSESLPKFTYQSRADAEALIGPFTITERYFNRDHKEVTKADSVGRYGAVVEVRDAGGMVRDTRFITLYRAHVRVTQSIMPEIGDKITAVRHLNDDITPAQVVAQQAAVDEYRKLSQEHSLSDTITQGVPPQNWLSHAVLLAGVSETKAGDPPVLRLSVRERDRRWWYEQKKRLGMMGTYRHIVEVPPGYAEGKERYPVLLFLHGSGERGTDVEQVRVHGPLRLIREGKTLPFILVAPQCEPGDRWLPQRVIDLLDEVEKQYRVDKHRVYLTGLSMGGYGTWATALEFPDRFAALVPICGGGDPKDAARIAHLPVWNFHGGKDPTVPIARSQEMVDALRATGDPEVYFKTYPEAGHDSWTETYDNPDVYAWLLTHKK